MISPVIENTDYYPFGLSFNSYSKPGLIAQNYKFGGKEVQPDLDFGWYDFDARFYDPSIARFANIDPHAETYDGVNPYNYAFNNPIIFVDPNGMDGTVYIQVIMTGDAEQDKALTEAVNQAVEEMNKAYAEMDVDLTVKANFGTQDDIMSKDEFYSREGADNSDSYVVLGTADALNSSRETLKDSGWGDIGGFNLRKTTANEGRSADNGDQLAGVNIDEMMTKKDGEWVVKKNHTKRNFSSVSEKISKTIQHESGHPKFSSHPRNKNAWGFTGEGVSGHVDGTIMQSVPTRNSKHDRLMMYILRQKHGKTSENQSR